LLRSVGLRLVGSRGRRVKPEQRSRGREPIETLTTELFLAGRRDAYHEWRDSIPNWSPETRGSDELAAVEGFHAPTAQEKIQPIRTSDTEIPLEVVLHASEFKRDAYILEAFEAFVKDKGLSVDLDRRIHAGGLCFLGLMAPKRKIEGLAEFSFLRVARQMPRLRAMQPILRSSRPIAGTPELPTTKAIDPNIRVAIFDGGLDDKSPLSAWVRSEDAAGIGKPVHDYLEHGHGVTSALLFGSGTPGAALPRPYANVNHYRVVDSDSENDPFELVDVLERVRGVLSTRAFDFINLSIGPAAPIDDNEVHSWTSVLDEYLADGKTLAAVAAGNNGDADEALGYNRVQVPADCVNALAVGAADRSNDSWSRAPYSAVGPGRSPGIVKPDVVRFGGSDAEPYIILSGQRLNRYGQTCGTSYSSPDLLRTAIGIRAHLGQLLTPLAIKALLIHCADPQSHPRGEVGWGRVPDALDDIVTCPAGVVRVVYQGELMASKYLRAALPLPAATLKGSVSITATFCYTSATDPAHPSNYTRGGLEVFFRPDAKARAPKAMHAKTASFFRPGDLYPDEDELRRDAHKWETCLHASVTKRGSGLNNPVFDIHYNARAQGQNHRAANKIPYALVITVEAPGTKDLYDQVMRRYRTILEPLTPVVQIPIRT
jgi:Subtilase family